MRATSMMSMPTPRIMGFTIYDLRLTRKQTRNKSPVILFHQAQHFLDGGFQIARPPRGLNVAQTFVSAGSRDILVPCPCLIASGYLRMNWRLESRQNSQTGMSALHCSAIIFHQA